MGGPPAAHREVRRSLRVDRSDGWSPVAERRRQEPAYRPTHRHLRRLPGGSTCGQPWNWLYESRSSHNSIRPQTSERPSSPPRRVRGGLAEAERHVTQWSTSTTSHSRWCSTPASTSTCDRPAPPSTSDQPTSSPCTDPHDRRPPPLGDRAASPAVRGETSSGAGLSRWGWSKKPGVSWAIESSTLMTAPAAAGGNVLVSAPVDVLRKSAGALTTSRCRPVCGGRTGRRLGPTSAGDRRRSDTHAGTVGSSRCADARKPPRGQCRRRGRRSTP